MNWNAFPAFPLFVHGGKDLRFPPRFVLASVDVENTVSRSTVPAPVSPAYLKTEFFSMGELEEDPSLCTTLPPSNVFV